MATNETKPEAAHPDAGGLVPIGITQEAERARQTPQWAAQDRHLINLAQKGPLSVRLLMLKSGAELPEHRAPGTVVVHVISGSVLFRNAGAQQTLSAASMVVLEPGMSHSVKALEDTTILLTIVNG